MIRQAISCDVCGAEKKQTNHWFVAYAHGGELRVTGWNGPSRMRAGSKHLCGQTCLHKLVDEFIAGAMATRVQTTAAAMEQNEPVATTDASLTSKAAYASPAPVLPVAPRALQVVPAALIAVSPSSALIEPHAAIPAPPVAEPPNYASRRLRAEAWERERERERRSSLITHRKTF